MKRFIEGENRHQSTLFPESLEDYIAEDNAIRIVEAITKRPGRNEFTYTGLQHETGNQRAWNKENYG